MSKIIGNWWADHNIELVEINKKIYALSGWNGEKWCSCWQCSGKYNMDASQETYIIYPVYAADINGNFEIINYILE